MRIVDPTAERDDAICRLSAEVEWEDSLRPSRRVYFEKEDTGGSGLEVEPLVVAALAGATWHGETRLWVDGSVCPWLGDGLRAAASFLVRQTSTGSTPEVETRAGFRPLAPATRSATTSLFSGGIDALALLRANLLSFPEGHPRRIERCVLVFGLSRHDLDDGRPVEEALDRFRGYRDVVGEVLADAGVTTTTVYTNVRAIYEDEAWWNAGFSGGLVGAGLAANPAATDLLVASDGLGFHTDPLSMNAYLMHCYSTTRTSVTQAQVAWTRLEKTRLVAAWPEGLRVLRSCDEPVDAGELPNCGRCNKCLRTKLGLLAVGADLSRVPTFEGDDVAAADLSGFQVRYEPERTFTVECVEPLRRQGRDDLARVLEERVADHDALARRERSIWRKAYQRLR